MTTTPEPRRPTARERTQAIVLLAIAACLFLVTFTIPHLPKRSPELVREFGLDREKGDSFFELTHDGNPVGDVVPEGARLGVRFHGAGYLFLWLVEIHPGGKFTVILPREGDRGMPWGRRIEPAGEHLEGVFEVSGGDHVYLAVLSPVPMHVSDFEKSIQSAGAADPLTVARALRFRGVTYVRAVRGE